MDNYKITHTEKLLSHRGFPITSNELKKSKGNPDAWKLLQEKTYRIRGLKEMQKS